MVEYNPLKWNKKGTAKFIYGTLDPVFGEGAPLEEVADEVREGDLIGAGLEAVENVFVEPVIDYTQESVVDPVVDPTIALYDDFRQASEDSLKDLTGAAEKGLGIALVLGLAYLATR